MNRSKFAYAMLLGTSCLIAPSMALAQAQSPKPAESNEVSVVTVTATRETTNIQKTAVQVSAFTQQKLVDASATSLTDITYLVPSVRFTFNSTPAVSFIAIRGVGIPPVGTAGQGVTLYEEEVPIAGPDLNLNTYDVTNVQVLQGPQGTLFGRNTLAGAVLIDPVLPSFRQNGYFKAGYGNYNAWTLEGAANATVIPDVLAMRFSGQIQRHDAIFSSVTPSLSGQDTLRTEGFRVSVLFTPNSKLKNVTTFDYFHEDDQPNPGQVNNPLAAFNGNFSQTSAFSLDTILGTTPALATDAQKKGAAAFFGYPATLAGYNTLQAGILAAVACKHRCVDYGTIPDSEIYTHQDNYRLFNTTTYELTRNIELKNIFGYQDTKLNLGENASGGPANFLLSQQFSSAPSPSQAITEEFQVRGKAWDDRVTGTVGVFYQHSYDAADQPAGLLTPFGTPSAADSTSKAIYANGTFAITSTLKFRGGVRYTWDSLKDCGLDNTGTTFLPTASQCFAQAATSTLPGEGIVSQKASAPTWSVGLDWQATDDTFFYVVSRRGYRAGGVNSPVYSGACINGASSGYTPGAAGAGTSGVANSGVLAGKCADFGLAVSGGQVASGKSIDLSSEQTIQPETLTDVEVGMRSNWTIGGWHERLNLTYYHYWYDNVLSQISWGDASASPRFGFPAGDAAYPVLTGAVSDPAYGAAAVNVGSLVANGIDADLAVIPTHDLSFDFTFSYMNQTSKAVPPPAILAQLPSGVSTVAIANATEQFTSPTSPYSFTITARYVLPWHPMDGDLALNYNYFWTSDFHAQGVQEPGYDQHNIRLDWNHIGGSNVSAGLWVKNLTDIVTPLGVGAGSGLDAFIYTEPRMFGADLTVKFD